MYIYFWPKCRPTCRPGVGAREYTAMIYRPIDLDVVFAPLSRVPIFIFYSYVFHIACMPFKESVEGVMALQEVISVFLLFCTGIRGRTILTICRGNHCACVELP